jgi:hypothetical protein
VSVNTLLRFPHVFREFFGVIAAAADPAAVDVARQRELMVNYGLMSRRAPVSGSGSTVIPLGSPREMAQ